MTIILNNISPKAIYTGGRNIIKVYAGSKLVWQVISDSSSCYGSGYWINNLPFINEDSWKNLN